MSIKIRIEVSSLATPHQSGVSSYTRLLVNACAANPSLDVSAPYFNFLRRQPLPSINNRKLLRENPLIPLRVYAKAQSFSLAPAFDIGMPKVDLTIFPNFATWPTINSRHVATVIHDLTYLYFPEVVEEKNLAHLQRVVPRSIKKADLIITVSESVKKELINEFNLDPQRCIVTPIPPDESFFNIVSTKDISSVKNKYSLTQNKKYIYFIGNLEPRKNLKTLIEAYTLLPDDIKNDYSLVLAGGKGWKTQETQASIDSAVASGEDVKHIGFIDQNDSAALYQGASLYVMPSLYEGFGMPILEAMASGTPVVASDIPVLREVGAGYATYANPRDPKDFSKAILHVLTQPKKARSVLQKNVRRFSWDKNISELINAVRTLT